MDEPKVVIEKGGSGLGAFVLGLAIGAGLALLFAPQTGEETRRTLVRGARRVRRAALDVADDVSDKVGNKFKSTRADVERAIQAGREAAHLARHDVEKRLTETKAAYRAGARVARERKGRNA